MNDEEWVRSVPEEITNDTLWKMAVYRQALFLSELAWIDVTKLVKDRRTMRLSDQLYRSAGSISANLAEGYSYSSKKDQARFFEYALGSARETRDWYYKARHVLGEEVSLHRIRFLTQVIRQLLTMLPNLRGYSIQEESPGYEDYSIGFLLDKIPLPKD